MLILRQGLVSLEKWQIWRTLNQSLLQTKSNDFKLNFPQTVGKVLFQAWFYKTDGAKSTARSFRGKGATSSCAGEAQKVLRAGIQEAFKVSVQITFFITQRQMRNIRTFRTENKPFSSPVWVWDMVLSQCVFSDPFPPCRSTGASRCVD